MKETLVEAAKLGGSILMNYFGRVSTTMKSDNTPVTEADLASEEAIRNLIESRYPDCNLIGEEQGFKNKSSSTTWVIDPLDGTHNYARGMPWFGILIAVLHDAIPVLGVMYLPFTETIYVAETGGGVWRNDKRVEVSGETNIDNIICSCCIKPHEEFNDFLSRASTGCTASLLDYCHTVDGRTGAFLFDRDGGSIWDIAGLPLMLKEAGGVLTDLKGNPISLDLSENACKTGYDHLGANKYIHEQIMQLVSQYRASKKERN